MMYDILLFNVLHFPFVTATNTNVDTLTPSVILPSYEHITSSHNLPTNPARY